MFEKRKEVLKTHKTLSELCETNPDVFENTVRSMVERVIKQGSNPKILAATQKAFEKMKKTAVDEKLTQLANHFNGGRS